MIVIGRGLVLSLCAYVFVFGWEATIHSSKFYYMGHVCVLIVYRTVITRCEVSLSSLSVCANICVFYGKVTFFCV